MGTANILSGLGTGPLDVRIKRLAGQRDDLQDTLRRLKLDLEEERSRSSLARGAASQEELERETKKLLDEYKFKISKSEQEIATLTANVARLESQVMRYKTTSETLGQAEDCKVKFVKRPLASGPPALLRVQWRVKLLI